MVLAGKDSKKNSRVEMEKAPSNIVVIIVMTFDTFALNVQITKRPNSYNRGRCRLTNSKELEGFSDHR